MRWIVIFLFIPSIVFAQSVQLKGVVRSAERETLPLAHIVILPDSITTVANASGEFSTTLLKGSKKIIVSYTGYETIALSIELNRDTTLHVDLPQKIGRLQEVVVTSERDAQTDLFESTQASTNILSAGEVKSIPVLGGEADPIKVLQLMPGTLRGIEGSADLFVRGGAADQNLVLLDEVPIYNTSHLFGFVSVFNPDILESVESVNGGFPANYGGRLSSILNVRTKSTVADETHISGDVGLIASRLFIDQPIAKNKASIWVAGRRTYVDKVVRLIGEELPYFFYDLNAKILFKPSANDDVSISFYNGKDILNLFRDRNNDGDGFLTTYKSGNNSQSIQWNRSMANNWTASMAALRTSYQYSIQNAFEDNRLVAFSDIEDVGVKISAAKSAVNSDAFFKTGVDWILHDVSPSVVSSSGTVSEIFASSMAQGREAHELAFYGFYEWSLSSRWDVNSGLRYSMAFVKDKVYAFPEPRLSARFRLNDSDAFKFSYARMTQYMHRISNSAVTSPTDVWYPITESVKPQTSHQFSISWQRNLLKEDIFLSAESYYKHMDNLVGFEEGTNLFFNADFESKLIQGRGSAYGFEVLVKKEAGKLTGWISYTLSWSRRQFDAINGGLWFPSRYDRRHNGAIVAQYAFHDRWSVSAVWEFISGSKFTPIIGQYIVSSPTSTGVDLLPVYAPVNSVKLADTHRLDIGIKFKSKPHRKFRYEWFAGVYNTYNRANPVGITIEQNENDGSLVYEQPGIFGLLPFISYGFKF